MSTAQFLLHVDARHVSPYAMSAYVALREKGVPFELRHVDLRAAAQRAPDYARDSLTCRVPMLSHGDFHLSESSAIAEYLDELLPAPGYRPLYPGARQARARARQIQAWLRSDLMALRDARPTTAVFGAALTTPLPAAAVDDGMRLCALVESLLPAGATQLFSEWSLADTDLALMLQRLLNNGDALPARVAAYVRAQWQRPSVQAWLALPRTL
jgi:glutathione S-transferase